MVLSASTLDCDDSRVNFSREIELQPLNAVKRRPMSGANCSNSTSSTVSMFLVFARSHHHSRDLISRSNLGGFLRIQSDRTYCSSNGHLQLIESQYSLYRKMLIPFFADLKCSSRW